MYRICTLFARFLLVVLKVLFFGIFSFSRLRQTLYLLAFSINILARSRFYALLTVPKMHRKRAFFLNVIFAFCKMRTF